MSLLKRVAARLPMRWQSELRRAYFARQIHRNAFVTDEPELEMLDSLVGAGDWVIDVGANVGHYAKRLSELVGARGRVIAFEPVPETFSLLAANAELFAHRNVTLVNAAASDRLGLVGMSIPTFPSGLVNYYEARIAPIEGCELRALAMPLDALCSKQPIALVKIDAEGHETAVLDGMRTIVEASRPVLIMEAVSDDVIARVSSWGYVLDRLPGSPNVLFRPKG